MATSINTLLFNVEDIPDEVLGFKEDMGVNAVVVWVTVEDILVVYPHTFMPSIEVGQHVKELTSDDYYQFMLLEPTLTPTQLLNYFIGDACGDCKQRLLIDTGGPDLLILEDTRSYLTMSIGLPIYSSDLRLGIKYFHEYEILKHSMSDLEIFELFLKDHAQ